MNIAVIDDHVLLAETLANVLRQHLKEASIKTFKSGADFLAANFNEWQPSLVILDMLMPGKNGVEVMDETLFKFGSGCKFILLSSIVDVHTIKNAMRMGASGYLGKETPIEEVLDAIATVMEGGNYIGKGLRDNLVKHVFAEDQVTFHLTPREKEVLDSLCKGKTPKEIAYDAGLSLYTIQEYIKSTMRKFKVNRTTDMVMFAIQKGLYNPGENK